MSMLETEEAKVYCPACEDEMSKLADGSYVCDYCGTELEKNTYND
jgi:ribosomal protein L37AE/L43A